MKRRAEIALLGLIVLVAGTEGCRKKEPPPVGLEAGPGGPLSFPPADEGWTERRPLPPSTKRELRRDDRHIYWSSPTLDDTRHFTFEGSTLRVYFTDAVFDPNTPKKAPTLTITPAVKGKTVWDSASSVEFRADTYFDPEVAYTVTVGAATAPSGKTLESATATFKASPAIEIAGKTIHYIPQPGKARVVALLPNDADKLGGPQEATVVFDQPIELGAARALVSLKDEGGANVASSLRHPTSDVFEGTRTDRRNLVVIRPSAPRAAGTRLVVAAKPQDGDDPEKTHTYTIAEPTRLSGFACGDCETVGTDQVVGSSFSSLNVKYTNPLGIAWDQARKVVHISPEPKSLYVSAWENLSIGGSFQPSTTYAVRIDAVRDQYGGRAAPVAFTFRTRALPVSATMSEGVSLLDDAGEKIFPVTTRNAERASLELWALPKGDVNAFARALQESKSGVVPTGDATLTVPFATNMQRDVLVDATVDLSGKLERGRGYVARVKIDKGLDGADGRKFASGSDASRPAVAVLYPAGPNALGAHVHHAGEKAVVQVFRLATGEPVAGAKVTVGAANAVTTDLGTAQLAIPAARPEEERAVAVSAGDSELLVPLDGRTAMSSAALFPDLAPSALAESGDLAGMILTDRGVYRPGSNIELKAFARRQQDGGVKPMPRTKVRLRLVDPTDTEVWAETADTNERGAVVRRVALDKSWHTGRFHLRLELEDEAHTMLADEIVRIAAFETPKFKVDVEPAEGSERLPPDRIKAKVVGRYLFGAPMGGAKVAWVVKKTALPVDGGALADAGFDFSLERNWWSSDEGGDESLRPVTGEGELGADGALIVDAATGPLAQGPTEVTLEADVSDTSNRHIAGQWRTRKDPFPRHAGIKLARRFGDASTPVHATLAVVDGKGEPVVGAKVSARLERLAWRRSGTKAESGATVERWGYETTLISECEVVSTKTGAACDLPVGQGGSYRVTAKVDGRDDASSSFWAYGQWQEGGRAAVPSSGKKIPLVLDKAKYTAGETAQVLVQSPYAKAVALLTVEQGGILRHESKRVEGPTATFDVPVTAANAPWLNAVVTLLPIGETEADYRVAAARVPVGAEDAKFDVRVASSKPKYEVGDEAEITVEVKHKGAPVKNTGVTLAVVDEGVLRMTAFHAKDPAATLHPGRALAFRLSDSRAMMIGRREKAHVAGGGDSSGEDALDTRKNFVETAAWLPNLTTDDKGRAVAKVKLPDNLTEFRMMAVAVDDLGSGGMAESSFVVSKSFLLEPVMPRFVARGDQFEAAAMVHNNTDRPASAKVTIADQARDVTVPAHGHERVFVPLTADEVGTRTMRFTLAVDGKALDKVEIPLVTDEPGIDEHPQLSGVFTQPQEVHVSIPADAVFEEGAALSIKTGSSLYPELGQRLGYLLDYPHGCVEQTTSSILPLLAARTIMPWTGTASLEDAEIKKRIEAGVLRLSTMRTENGGLAYWPGQFEPNLFGSAYALQALVRARAIGIERPKLIEDVTAYLIRELEGEGNPDLRTSIAGALASAGALPESAADSLYDARERLDASGLANLAIALGSLPNQADRVKDVMGRLEAAFDDKGDPTKPHGERDWRYWGSADRDRAQAVIALVKHDKGSPLLPRLAGRLVHGLDRWTTQSTAWSLTALTDFIGDKDPRGAVDVDVKLEGKLLDTTRRLGGDNKEVRVPLADLKGRRVTLILKGDGKTAAAFAFDAHYKRPFGAASSRLARRAPEGPSIHRTYSDPRGNPIDLAQVKAGDVVRVALRIELAKIDVWRQSYLAVTDRLPAGFEPVDPDLATTASVPDLSSQHPYYEGLTGYGASASHVDLRDDKVQIYFDETWNNGLVYATYLVRATTRGSFVLPPASGELMYEPNSLGYSDAGAVVIR